MSILIFFTKCVNAVVLAKSNVLTETEPINQPFQNVMHEMAVHVITVSPRQRIAWFFRKGPY